jgi:3-oxoacyl-(acyl-carrier-protein) synthase
VRVTVTRLGIAAPRAGEREVLLDVRGEWPSAPERMARTDRVCHLALLAAYRALGEPPGDDRPIAVVYGSGHASLVTNLRYYEKILRRGPRGADPKRFPYTSPNAAAGEVAIAFGLVGPNVTVTSGFASGLEAIAIGARLVARGRVPAALVVAADAWADEVGTLLAGAGIEMAEGPREGAAALLLEPDGAEGARGVLDEIRTGRDTPQPGPVTPAPAPLFPLQADRSLELSARCPLSGGWAAVRWTPT